MENSDQTDGLKFRPQVCDKTERRLTVNISEVQYENKQCGYLVRQYKQLPKIYLTLQDACTAIATGICAAFGGSTRFEDQSRKSDYWDYLENEVSEYESEDEGEWALKQRLERIKSTKPEE